jgi:hypothetical protein
MFRIFTSLATRCEPSPCRNRTDRRPTRVRLGLESLEGRQVLSTMMTSMTLVAYYPPGPIAPATTYRWGG